ncbi:MAG: hypothetical protein Q9214_003140, partial [Letrouitia sp. 1 TL-2023]
LQSLRLTRMFFLHRAYCSASFIYLAILGVCSHSQLSLAKPSSDKTSDVGAEDSHILSARQFYHFQENYQPENIRPRPSGKLLVTVNTQPLLYEIDPSSNQVGGIVHRFDGYQSLFGIVESAEPDLYYLIANNFTSIPDFWGIPGSNSIFSVDLRQISDPTTRHGSRRVKVTKIVDIPEAGLLDGLTIVNAQAGLLITGDAQSGTLYLIDTTKRTAKAVLKDALLAGTATDRAASLAHTGINGIKFYGPSNKLYITNTAKGLLVTIGLNPHSGMPTTKPVVVEDLGLGDYLDDLSFDRKGNQYICEPLKGVRFRPAEADRKGHSQKSSLLVKLANANANTFGRMEGDECILYTTFGAPLGENPGIARVNTKSLGFCKGKKVQKP